MARHFQSPFRRSPHYSRPQRPQINLNKGGFLQIKNHRRGSQPCWDMNWNECPAFMELHGDNCSRNGVIQQRLQHLWSYARREQQIRRYRPFNDPVTPKMLLSLRITPFLLHSAKMLKWEGPADQRKAVALGEEAPRWHPWLMRGPPTQREAPNRCGLLHSV